MKWGWSDRNSILVNFIHDELLLEVEEEFAKPAMEILKDVMIEVAEEMHEGIPADVEVHSSKNWGEVKE